MFLNCLSIPFFRWNCAQGCPLAKYAVVYLYRFLGSPEADGERLTEFADASEVSEHARDAMAWAAEAELLVTEDGKLRPADPITRAELASILVRYYEKYNDTMTN